MSNFSNRLVVKTAKTTTSAPTPYSRHLAFFAAKPLDPHQCIDQLVQVMSRTSTNNYKPFNNYNFNEPRPLSANAWLPISLQLLRRSWSYCSCCRLRPRTYNFQPLSCNRPPQQQIPSNYGNWLPQIRNMVRNVTILQH